MIAVETLGSKQVYANPWMTVRKDAIRRSDGSTGIYGVVDSPDIALIIPADGDRLHLVRAVSVPARRSALGIPLRKHRPATRRRRGGAGRTRAARRNRAFGQQVDPARHARCRTRHVLPTGKVFLATDLTHGAPQRELEEQDMRSVWFTRRRRAHDQRRHHHRREIHLRCTLLLLHGPTSHV